MSLVPFRLASCWRTSKLFINDRYFMSNWKHQPSPSGLPIRIPKRWMSKSAEHSNLYTQHSMFVAEKSLDTKWLNWKEGIGNVDFNQANGSNDLEELREGQGKLAPTSSHLFKLILPLGHLLRPAGHTSNPETTNSAAPIPPPTVFLLHPSQPISHVSRLIQASFAPDTPTISFRSLSQNDQAFQWSESTDLGDFVRDAARTAEFRVVITYTRDGTAEKIEKHRDPSTMAEDRKNGQGTLGVSEKEIAGDCGGRRGISSVVEKEIRVEIPTFADRTRFLRRRLSLIEGRIRTMELIKKKCDHEAHRGARRLAVGGFAMLVVYWAAVARLTFWDFGWDIMEPITYLSGLTMAVLGYLWFLYQGREVSYSSVLNRSISSRREALYHARGFDMELWTELLTERRNVRRGIGRIAEDYDDGQNEKEREDSDTETASDGTKDT